MIELKLVSNFSQWFQEKISEIENLDTQLQKLHSALKALVLNRRELSGLSGQVAKTIAILSTCEENTSLSRALSQLADTEEKVELLRFEQSSSDLFILAEIIKDYLGLLSAIKDVFHERVKVCCVFVCLCVCVCVLIILHVIMKCQTACDSNLNTTHYSI